MSKLQKNPSALKRGHPTLQNMNFYNFFLLLWVIFALLVPDPDSESGSTDPIEFGSNPDPQPCLKLSCFYNPLSVDRRIIILVPDVQREAPAGYT
jgi:hypothetical protein